MKLLLINYEFPPLGGGAGQATAALAREFAAAGHEASVLTSRFRGQPAFERVGGVEIHRVRVVRRREDRCTPPEMVTFMGSAAFAALGLARRWRPDATIAFFGIPSGPVSLLLRLAAGTPYLVSLRGGDVPGFQPYDLAKMHRRLGPLIRLIWRRSCGVVANSGGLQALARSFAPELPVAVIPNGVDATAFSPAPKQEEIAGPVRLLFVGRLVYQKGLDVLLAALAPLAAETDFHLELIGDGDERAGLEAEARRRGFAPKLTFSGWLARDEIARRYRAAEVFVFPSRDEGMPNVVLEAMASGLPIVATAIAGSEELVRDGINGLLVPSENAAALTGALRRIIADAALRAKMGRASRARIEAEYTWSQVAACYLETLRKQCVPAPS